MRQLKQVLAAELSASFTLVRLLERDEGALGYHRDMIDRLIELPPAGSERRLRWTSWILSSWRRLGPAASGS